MVALRAFLILAVVVALAGANPLPATAQVDLTATPEEDLTATPEEDLTETAGESTAAEPVATAEVVADTVVTSAPIASQPQPPVNLEDVRVRFSFDRTPWRDVIRWIADEAGLALHVGELPTGSFSYADPSEFTLPQAIDRINLFLLPDGYTIIRSGRMLSVINLADPRSEQQLEVLAEMVSVDQLQELPSQDVVKCLFPLGEIDAEDAVEELSVLNLMTTPEVLGKTNQLLMIDTAGKLRNVLKILDAFHSDQLDNGTVVKSFVLQHVDAEDILAVARPHLGLAPDEMIGIDVSVSSDPQGKHLFVTGVEDKVKLLEGLVQSIDQPKPSLLTGGGQAELRNHLVEGGNVETVYNVLQTLLAGKDVRLSMDEASNSVVALAAPEVQAEIAQTVLQLQASEADFEVIPLKTADPYFVISLLEEMLDLPGPLDDPDDIDPNAPKIDADPGNRRLFVRAKRPQIEQIKKIVEGLDGAAPEASTGQQMRVLPLHGPRAESVLEAAAKFWRGDNPVVVYRSLIPGRGEPTERVLTDTDPSQATSGDASRVTSENLTQPTFGKPSGAKSKSQRWLTTNVESREPVIRCQLTPQGLLVQSDDGAALDEFEQHLRLIAGPLESMPSPTIVFYLKYTKANDALRMLSELIEGGEIAEDVSANTLVNGYVPSGSSFLGSFVTSQDGTLTLSAGTMTVIADSRLNRLIAQGSTQEIDEIEGYLKIIDKDNSITSVETYGTSQVIELKHCQASEVAEAIREAFAGRVVVSEASQAKLAAQQGGQPQPRPVDQRGDRDSDRDRDRRDDSRQASARSGQPVVDLEPKMTVAVHEPSNSLIVTAPQQLFEEVEKLARSIDSRAEQTVEVITPANGAVFESVLLQFLGQEGARRPSSSASSTRSSDRSESNSFRRRGDE